MYVDHHFVKTLCPGINLESKLRKTSRNLQQPCSRKSLAQLIVYREGWIDSVYSDTISCVNGFERQPVSSIYESKQLYEYFDYSPPF